MAFGRSASGGLLLMLVVAAWACSDESRELLPADAFCRGTLLCRFDEDDDGQFHRSERAALRKAFGDIDVPMLPSPPYEYVDAAAPSTIDEEVLKRLDSTPDDNPLTDAGATLGRVLFYDKQLSRSRTISCASCHPQSHAFSDPRQFSLGFEGGSTKRNAMSLVNLRYTSFDGRHPGFFWDERARTLEEQVLMPIQDPVEMGMELSELEARLQSLPYYPPLFQAAFGSPTVTSERIAKGIAQFLRAITSFDSKCDQAARAMGSINYAEDFDAFTDEENAGKSLFVLGVGRIAEFGCAHCHLPPTFGMRQALNNGLDLQYEDQGLGLLKVPSNDPFTANNDGKFKAPSLRNIALTAPYMHDGRFQTLEEVVEHYSSGVHPHPNLGLAFEGQSEASGNGTHGFQLSPEQKSALVAFLKTLTDERLISDPKFSDPFVRLER